MTGWRLLVLVVGFLAAMPIWSWGAELVSASDNLAVAEGAAILIGLVVGVVCLVRVVRR